MDGTPIGVTYLSPLTALIISDRRTEDLERWIQHSTRVLRLGILVGDPPHGLTRTEEADQDPVGLEFRLTNR